MPSYLVRIHDTKEVIGLFSVETEYDLYWLIDEVTDPGTCECTAIHPFAMYYPPGKRTPYDHDNDGEYKSRIMAIASSDFERLSLEYTLSESAWIALNDAFSDERLTNWKPVERIY